MGVYIDYFLDTDIKATTAKEYMAEICTRLGCKDIPVYSNLDEHPNNPNDYPLYYFDVGLGDIEKLFEEHELGFYHGIHREDIPAFSAYYYGNMISIDDWLLDFDNHAKNSLSIDVIKLTFSFIIAFKITVRQQFRNCMI